MHESHCHFRMQQQLLLVLVLVVKEQAVKEAVQQTLSQHAAQIGPHLIVDHAMCASAKYGTTACSNAQQALVAL